MIQGPSCTLKRHFRLFYARLPYVYPTPASTLVGLSKKRLGLSQIECK